MENASTATVTTTTDNVTVATTMDNASSTVKSPRFKDVHSFEKRRNESMRILSKYPDRIPVICDFKDDVLALATDSAPPKVKYLVPTQLTIGQLVHVVRKRIGSNGLDSSKALYLFINDTTLAPTTANLATVYAEYRDPDGFLYITVATENTFG